MEVTFTFKDGMKKTFSARDMPKCRGLKHKNQRPINFSVAGIDNARDAISFCEWVNMVGLPALAIGALD